MKSSLSAAGLLLAIGSGSAFAQELVSDWHRLDCRALVLEERARLIAAGEPVTSEHMGPSISRCMRANAEAELEALQSQVDVLRTELAELNLRIDEQARILDERGEQIARLKRTIDGLEIEIQTSQQKQVAILRRAEEILADLVAS